MLEHVHADVQKQLKAAQEQLSVAEQSRAAEAERLQQTESKLAAELKQAKLDIQQVLPIGCSREYLACLQSVDSCLQISELGRPGTHLLVVQQKRKGRSFIF